MYSYKKTEVKKILFLTVIESVYIFKFYNFFGKVIFLH